MTQTRDIVKRWKEHFEELLNLSNTSSVEEAESEDLGEASPISLAEARDLERDVDGPPQAHVQAQETSPQAHG